MKSHLCHLSCFSVATSNWENSPVPALAPHSSVSSVPQWAPHVWAATASPSPDTELVSGEKTIGDWWKVSKRYTIHQHTMLMMFGEKDISPLFIKVCPNNQIQRTSNEKIASAAYTGRSPVSAGHLPLPPLFWQPGT